MLLYKLTNNLLWSMPNERRPLYTNNKNCLHPTTNKRYSIPFKLLEAIWDCCNSSNFDINHFNILKNPKGQVTRQGGWGIVYWEVLPQVTRESRNCLLRSVCSGHKGVKKLFTKSPIKLLKYNKGSANNTFVSLTLALHLQIHRVYWTYYIFYSSNVIFIYSMNKKL